ncbi:MAG: hypothetical protein HOW73_14475 [Polyangiaceae bacterium]|nr:hypothetical protein [Polyangiaceae bacterium]
MGFDAVTRRYSLAIFLGLVALAAYFQASGIGALVSGHLVPSSAPKIVSGKSSGASSLPPTKSGKDVLARNAFDSVTGPLDGSTKVAETEEPAPKPAAHFGADPYQDAACAGVSSSLITAAEDHAWSFASIAANGEDKLRRIGDKVGAFTVQHIGYYESENHDIQPRVWLVDGTSRCIVEMGSAPPPTAKPAPTTTERPTTSKKASQRKELENKVKSKITKVGDGKFEVDKSGVEMIIQHYAKLAGSLRGKATKDGMKLTGIKESSILHELGMQSGDMLQSINGFDMTDPDKAVDAYAKLRRAGKLEIAYSRDGSPQKVEVQIK